MPALSVVIDVEHHGFRAMRDLAESDPLKAALGPDALIESGDLIHLGNDAHIEVGALAGGMSSGAPSVAFCFRLPDGRVVLAETSMALLLTAAHTLATVYGDPR